MLFVDRSDAGARLGQKLLHYRDEANAIVLGLPRGGLIVACEVARLLDMPLDIFTVRKLGAPRQPELALGAVASGGVSVLNQRIIAALAIDNRQLQTIIKQERQRILQLEKQLRGTTPPPLLKARLVILVDDGLATGATMQAAVESVRQHNPQKVVVAAPVASRESCQQLSKYADEVIVLQTPHSFMGVGQWYNDFHQISMEEVRRALNDASLT